MITQKGQAMLKECYALVPAEHTDARNPHNKHIVKKKDCNTQHETREYPTCLCGNASCRRKPINFHSLNKIRELVAEEENNGISICGQCVAVLHRDE